MPPRSCQRAALAADPELRGLIRYATLAPNGHNAQPWRFRAQDGGIAILPDLTRRTPVVDPDDHHLFVSLGEQLKRSPSRQPRAAVRAR